MNSFITKALFLILFLSLALTRSYAAEYYVEQVAGSPSHPGTEAQPFNDIDKCAAVMVAGDTCWVKNGTYSNSPPALEAQSPYEPANSGTEANPIVFRAYPGHSPVLKGVVGTNPDGGGHRNYITWSGFRMDGTFLAIGNSGLGGNRLKGWIFENNEIYNGAYDGDFNWSGIYIVDGEGIIIRDNEIRNISSGNQYDDGAGVRFFRCKGCIIEHNYIHDNRREAFYDKEGGVDNIVRRNIIENNGAAQIRVNNQANKNYGGNPSDPSTWIFNQRTQIYENIFKCNNSEVVNIKLLVRASDAKIYNNVFHECRGIQANPDINPGWESYNNIFYYSSTTIAYESMVWDANEPAYSDHNIFLNSRYYENRYSTPPSNGEEAFKEHKTFSSWRSKFPAYDQNSLTSDPLFEQAGSNYRLKSGSPALSSGRYGLDIGAYPRRDDTVIGIRPGGGPTETPAPTPTPTPTPPSPTPTPSGDPLGLTFEAEDGAISPPFRTASDSSRTYLVQDVSTTDNSGGSARYEFQVTETAAYVIIVTANVPDASSNSVFLDIDSAPGLDDVWQAPVTSGFQPITVGAGSAPRVFSLTAGLHTLEIRGREKDMQLDSIIILKYLGATPVPTPTPDTQAPSIPQNFRFDE